MERYQEREAHYLGSRVSVGDHTARQAAYESDIGERENGLMSERIRSGHQSNGILNPPILPQVDRELGSSQHTMKDCIP